MSDDDPLLDPDHFGFGPPDVIGLDVDLDGEPLRIELPQPRGIDACTWAVRDDFLGLFPGALPDEQKQYWQERMRDPADPLTIRAIQAIGYRLGRLVFGVPWWAAHRLTTRCAANWWQYEAWTVTVGFDPRAPGVPATRIIGACWAFLSAGLDAEEGQELHDELWEAPAGPLGHEARLARGRAMVARMMANRQG
ncbi:hypothetical protein AB0A05_27425 [Streptomyces sp. NPDC046374]|uniref:hypothetical protein n=1 Tax=Streptomyces sp. NPDC046374 TaxID=3154917 RepID=UPI0034076957